MSEPIDIRDAMASVCGMFPGRSVNISLDVWSHVHQEVRQPITPSWRIHISSGKGIDAGVLQFGGPTSELSLEQVVQEARDYHNRQKMPRASLAVVRQNIKGL